MHTDIRDLPFLMFKYKNQINKNLITTLDVFKYAQVNIINGKC